MHHSVKLFVAFQVSKVILDDFLTLNIHHCFELGWDVDASAGKILLQSFQLVFLVLEHDLVNKSVLEQEVELNTE